MKHTKKEQRLVRDFCNLLEAIRDQKGGVDISKVVTAFRLEYDIKRLCPMCGK